MKKCDICGSKIGILNNYIKTSDGKIIGSECATDVFNDYQKVSAAWYISEWGNQHTLDDFIKLRDDKVSVSIAESVKNSKNEKKNNVSITENVKNNKNDDIEDIKRQLKECNVTDTFFTKKEIKLLPKALDKDEQIKYATSGYWGNHTVLMVCSNKRIIFINKSMIFGSSGSSISLKNINAVSYKTGMVLGQIDITNGADTITVDQVTKDTVKPMVDAIRCAKEKLEGSKSDTSNTIDAAEQIRKFKALMDEGIITEEEFNQKKMQLLDL